MTAPAPLAIDVRGLRKSFGSRAVVQGLDLRVAKGQICGFLGANGSGKTTTLRMLCGLLTPDAGEGTCLGLDIRQDAPRIRRRVGYMTQRFSFYEDLTVQENLDFVARLYELPDRERRVDAVLERAGLTDRRTQLVGELSGGWKQRMALAACVLHEPELLLLDEPTAGMGHEDVDRIAALIQRVGAKRTVLMVEHNLKVVANLSHTITVLARGEVLAEGDYAAVSKNKDVVQAYMGAEHA